MQFSLLDMSLDLFICSFIHLKRAGWLFLECWEADDA